MMKLLLYLAAFLAGLFLILILGYTLFGSNSDIRRRARRHFDVPTKDAISENSIKSSILRDLDKGSSKKKVADYIAKTRIREDELNYCDEKDDMIFCSIRFNQSKISFGLYRIVLYRIYFDMDAQDRLEGVRVEESGAML